MMNISLYRVGHDIASKFIELLGDNKTLAVIDQVKLQRNDYAPHSIKSVNVTVNVTNAPSVNHTQQNLNESKSHSGK